MELSESAVAQFQKHYEEHCGREITAEQATAYARDALELLQLIHQPIKRQDLAAVQEEVATLNEKHYAGYN